LEWFKCASDAVGSPEPLAEIEADNVTLELRAIVTAILAPGIFSKARHSAVKL
jgi:pyruvate/2-oxoglutarate dehydrogenase complex dihydrolipoamide acyltransferase (E2) component